MRWLVYLIALLWGAATLAAIGAAISRDADRRTDGIFLLIMCLMAAVPLMLICLLLWGYC